MIRTTSRLGCSAAICFAAIAVLALPSPSIAAAAAGGKVVTFDQRGSTGSEERHTR